MDPNQSPREYPLMKKLPFAQSVDQLHRHNKNVAQVSFNTAQSMIQAYRDKKDQYEKVTQKRYDIKFKALEELQNEKKKSLQAKQRQFKRRNQTNLSKIQFEYHEKRNKMTKKERLLMEESAARREQYLSHLASTFHYSQDKRNKIKMRQQNEVQQSILLFEKTQYKIKVANDKKAEILQDVKAAFKIKNQSILSSAVESCKEKQNSKKSHEISRLIQKYDSANKKLFMIGERIEKEIQEKRKQQQKLFQRHRQRRTAFEEQKVRRIEEDVKKDQFKIDKANLKKEQNLQQSVLLIQSKRKQKERQFLQNSYFLQQEADKRLNRIIHKHHESLINLTTAKAEKERLISYNLHDSFMATLRS